MKKQRITLLIPVILMISLATIVIDSSTESDAAETSIDSGNLGPLDENGQYTDTVKWALYNSKNEGYYELKLTGDGPTAYCNGTGGFRFAYNVCSEQYRSKIDTVTIEEGITELGAQAFKDLRVGYGNKETLSEVNLRTVNLPDSLQKIHFGAFQRCDTIESMNIPHGLKAVGTEAFFECKSLNSELFISKDMTIGGNAFKDSGFSSLVFEDGRETIPSAFKSMKNLKTVVIPNSVTTIAYDAYGNFSNCTSLETVVLPNNSSFTTIPQSCFSGCTSLEEVSIPDSVTTIGNAAFKNCPLESIVLPNNIKSIEAEAFNGSSYVGMFLPNIDSYEYKDASSKRFASTVSGSGFYCDLNGNYNRLFISNPDSVSNNIMKGSYIADTKGGYMPKDTVYSLGSFSKPVKDGYVFLGWCEEDSTEVVDKPVCEAGKFKIYEAKWIEDVDDGIRWSFNDSTLTIKPAGNGKSGVMRDFNVTASGFDITVDDRPWAGLIPLVKHVVVENGVTNIGDHSFRLMRNLESASLPNSITAIGGYAFRNCDNIKFTSITIPENVVSIGISAFNGTSYIKNIVMPDSVTTCGNAAFAYCYGLESFTVSLGMTELPVSFLFSDKAIVLKEMKLNNIVSFGTSSLGNISVDRAFVNSLDGIIIEGGKPVFKNTTCNPSAIVLDIDSGLTEEVVDRIQPVMAITSMTLSIVTDMTFDLTITLDGDDSIVVSDGHVLTNNGSIMLDPSTVTEGTIRTTLNYVIDEGFTNGNPVYFLRDSEPLSLTDAAREGYSFLGWYDNDNYTGDKVENIDRTNPISTTLYGKTDINSYSVTYELNGGSGTAPTQSDLEYNFEFTIKGCEGTKTGYIFAGWNDGTRTYNENDKYTLGAGNVVLKAQWNPIGYTIIFDVNTGSGSMDQLTMRYDESKKLTKCVLTKTGYTFDGWMTSASGSSADYADEAAVKNLADSDGATVKLYAKWKALQFDVTFVGIDGTISTTKYDYGSTISALKAATIDGLTFSGWYPSVPEMVMEDIVMKAQYKVTDSETEVSMDDNGRIVVDEEGSIVDLPSSIVNGKNIVLRFGSNVIIELMVDATSAILSDLSVSTVNTSAVLPASVMDRTGTDLSAFDFRATVGDSTYSRFSDTILVTIPYTGADSNTMVFYMDPNGTFEKMRVVSFDNTSITFETNHFSTYIATGVDLSEPLPIPPSHIDSDDGYQQWLQQYYQQLAEQQRQQAQKEKERNQLAIATGAVAVIIIGACAMTIARRH